MKKHRYRKYVYMYIYIYVHVIYTDTYCILKGYAHCRRPPVGKVDNCISKTANHRPVIGDRSTLPQQNACARYWKTHVEITPIVLENLSKMVPKSSQNLSKIDFWEVWRPLWSHPCAEVAPRHHFLRFYSILGPHLETSFGSFWVSFFCVFLWFFLHCFFTK